MSISEDSEWKQLAGAVDGGQLYLEREIAIKCAGHCTTFAEELKRIRRMARTLGEAEGFGTFPSGIALAEKFSKKAVGGDYSMVQALTDHIAEVEAMRDVFLRIEARYVAADERGAQSFAAIDS